MKGPLDHYLAILEGRSEAKYLELKRKRNGACLEEKIERVEEMLHACRLCERRCGIDRTLGKKGECGVGQTKIASLFLHFGEEEPLVPSLTVFFSGCTFKCVFCQNYDISTRPEGGEVVPPKDLAKQIEAMAARRTLPPRNVNWVGGEPTPHLKFILKTMKECEANIPQVWNSNMYMSQETMEILDGIVDLYLADFKFGNDACAERLCGVKNYFSIVSRNHLEAGRQAEVMVRHLVMPNHFECCTKPILEWLAKNLPSAAVNVMGQYRPEHNACEFPEISGPIKRKEFEEALSYAASLGLQLI